MRALEYVKSVPRYLAARYLGTRVERLTTSGFATIRLAEIPPPPLPAARWARVRPILAGICGSDWAFVPEPTAMPYQHLVLPETGVNTCQPGSIVLDPLLGDAPRQNFSAVLFGDCTGNWNSLPTARAQLSLSRDGRVRLGSPQRRGSGRWAIPLLVDSPEPYLSVEVRISYDGERTRPIQVRAAGTARDALLRYDTDDHGVLAVALASATPLTAEGPVATLLFESASRRADGHIAQLVAAAIDEVAVAVP